MARVRDVGKMHGIYDRPSDRAKRMLPFRLGRRHSQDVCRDRRG
jgi:hypothetical protein